MLIKRFNVLAEENEREVPEVGKEATFKVIAVNDSSPTAPRELSIFVTAVDPNWGPGHARIEGYIQDGNQMNSVIGYYANRETSAGYIGIIEVTLYEA